MTMELSRTPSPVTTGPSSTADDARRGRVLWVAATLSAVGFLVLSILVALGATQTGDDAARELFRPGDVWGPTQETFGYLVDGLAPPITATLLVLGTTVAAWRARSLRPLFFSGATAAVAVALTLGAKLVLGRPDGHGDLHGLASSYPSGHLVMLLVSGGCLLLLFRPRAREPWIALAVLGLLMGIAILVVAMHWLTDVLASALLAGAVLALAAYVRGAVDRRRSGGTA